MSDLRKLKTAGFTCATLAALVAVVNKFTSGQAVTAVETGTVDYAAGFAKSLTLIDQQYRTPDATHYTCVLFYAN